MTDIKSLNKALFLTEDELRRGIELMFFAYRDFTGEADAMLETYDLGRAHHRAIYFIGRHPDMTVSSLLEILNITKQSLSRVLSHLIDEGYVEQRSGEQDRRQRLLRLTEKGRKLEQKVTELQAKRFAAAYVKCGVNAVDGFQRVLIELLNQDTVTGLRKDNALDKRQNEPK